MSHQSESKTNSEFFVHVSFAIIGVIFFAFTLIPLMDQPSITGMAVTNPTQVSDDTFTHPDFQEEKDLSSEIATLDTNLEKLDKISTTALYILGLIILGGIGAAFIYERNIPNLIPSSSRESRSKQDLEVNHKQKIISYLTENYYNGFSLQDIRSELISSGWNPAILDEAIADFSKENVQMQDDQLFTLITQALQRGFSPAQIESALSKRGWSNQVVREKTHSIIQSTNKDWPRY